MSRIDLVALLATARRRYAGCGIRRGFMPLSQRVSGRLLQQSTPALASPASLQTTGLSGPCASRLGHEGPYVTIAGPMQHFTFFSSIELH